MRSEPRVEPIAIDVGLVLRGSVASLYSHLVTRPTGRAVRLAIEERVTGNARTALSLIDLSDVTVMDFSCADEIVAKLLMRFLEDDRPGDALFVFRGVCQNLQEPIQTVLERQELLAVVQGADGGCELIGTRTDEEEYVWTVLEGHGRIVEADVSKVFPESHHREALDDLVLRRGAFMPPEEGVYQALSTLVAEAP